ncbi:hypothetical protein VTO73DRAFT_6082 [Trametes versicolor]
MVHLGLEIRPPHVAPMGRDGPLVRRAHLTIAIGLDMTGWNCFSHDPRCLALFTSIGLLVLMLRRAGQTWRCSPLNRHVDSR